MNDQAGSNPEVVDQLRERFGEAGFTEERTRDLVPTLWVSQDRLIEILGFLKNDVHRPYKMLYDLTAIDERQRSNRDGRPDSDFTVVHHLLSLDRAEFVRIKTPLRGDQPSVRSSVGLWPAANWYEREAWDMFGIRFDGHPNLRRILMPTTWQGHPLRKDHPARATEMEPYRLPDELEEVEAEALRFKPEDWGMQTESDGADLVFLNLGPQHPGTHGVLRVVLQLDGERIVDAVPDIGFHHRGSEKMGERQSWHSYIPYTDRVDYLGGVMNNLAYLTAVEKLAGIDVPPRAQMIRVMLSELFRIISHLVWYGTFSQDLGQLSPVFFMFNDRERALGMVEAICGARMHPNWFRIGGVAQDLPRGWDTMFRDFIDYFPARLREYDRTVMRNGTLQARTKGIGKLSLDAAIDWSVTGPNLRSCGLEWDFRKKMPYSGYEQFDFEIPTAVEGDSYARALVRVEEMRQSLRIIEQCVNNMPEGAYKSEHPLATPVVKDRTMHDIESLITHFLSVSWGPVIPPGEALGAIEATKGGNGYYLVSDGGTTSYRTRIRTPSFPHMQVIPLLCRRLLIPDLLAILGTIDFVLADVDR